MTTSERWQEEAAAAWLYKAVASAEPDPVKKVLFRRLSEAAERQAALLAGDLGTQPGHFRPSLRHRFVAAAARTVGPRRARSLLAALKVRGLSVYGGTRFESGQPLPRSTIEHAKEHEHRTGGGSLRAAVFGANDGLVSNTCLILGVAGAAADARTVALAGAAGLLAGAFSMAAGEYVSVRSQRELYEHQIAQEKAELERYPDEEAEELALIYEARGAPSAEARRLSATLLRNPEEALRTLAFEELGLNPDDLGSPWSAAVSSFLAFAIGAVLPLMPFILGHSGEPVALAAGISAAALFVMGAILSLFSGRHAVYGGLRMLAIGAAAGAATFFVGRALGIGLA